MARIKGGLNAKKKHNRVLKLAKGYRGARSKQYQSSKAVRNESTDQLIRRKKAERSVSSDSFGSLVSTQAARLNGLSYSKFMYGLKLAER